MSLTIETELKDVLNGLSQRFDKLEQKLDTMQKDITDLKIGQAETKGEIKTLNAKVDGIQKTVDKLSEEISGSKQDISDLKGVKSLIVPGFVAILASLLTFIFRGINLA